MKYLCVYISIVYVVSKHFKMVSHDKKHLTQKLIAHDENYGGNDQTYKSMQSHWWEYVDEIFLNHEDEQNELSSCCLLRFCFQVEFISFPWQWNSLN